LQIRRFPAPANSQAARALLSYAIFSNRLQEMTMGRGDRKTKKGKISIRSYGKARPHTAKKSTGAAKAAKPAAKKAAPAKKVAAKKPA
jgi:ribosomal small subunit protein bTHX